MISDWLIIVTNTRHERRALLGLKGAGFETWCPMRVIEFQVGPSRNRSRACRLVPGLPGYVLARGQDWREAFGIDGVRGVLAIGECPLRPSAIEIDRLHRQFDLTPAPVVEDAFRIGQDVRVTMSPAGHLDGILSRFGKSGRLVILGSIMGRVVQIEVDRKQVEPQAA